MRQVYERIVALLILCIPGTIAVYGWTLLRETFFNFFAGQGLSIFRLLAGILCFFIGLALVAGFIYFHDKKRNKIPSRRQQRKRESN